MERDQRWTIVGGNHPEIYPPFLISEEGRLISHAAMNNLGGKTNKFVRQIRFSLRFHGPLAEQDLRLMTCHLSRSAVF